MKRIYSYLFIGTIGLFGLASCSSDDNTPVVHDPIVGKWDLKTMDMKFTANEEVYLEMEDFSVEGLLVMQFDFKADNTVEYYAENEDEEGNTVVDSHTGTYAKDGDSVTITINNEPQTFSILMLDSTDLHLFTSEEYTFEEVDYLDEVTFKFKKM